MIPRQQGKEFTSMDCPHCGIEVSAENNFCPKCGAPLKAANGLQDRAESASVPASESGKERFQTMHEARSDSNSASQVVLWTGTFSSRAMLDNWLFGGLVTLSALIFGVWVGHGKPWVQWGLLGIVLIFWIYNLFLYISRRLGVRYQLTSQRFIHEKGILHHVSDRIDLVQITDLRCEQGLIERTLGIGTLRIISRDKSDPDLVVRGIDDAKGVAAKIDEARRAEQMQRGLLME